MKPEHTSSIVDDRAESTVDAAFAIMWRVPATLSYDADENIIYMSFPVREELTSRAEIAGHFQRVIEFWRKNCNAKKAYFVVDFENVTISVSELEFYAQQTKYAHEVCAITSVRYGGNPLQRTVTRLAGMMLSAIAVQQIINGITQVVRAG